MSSRIQKTEEKNPYLFPKDVLHTALDILISLYMLLILVVLPFFNRQGFLYIGTDKAYFFLQCSVRTGKVIIPVLVLYLAAKAAVFAWEKKQKSGEAGRKSTKSGSVRGKGIERGYGSITDAFALLYGISVLLSYVCSEYRDTALEGSQGWYMGLYAQVSLVAVYFLVSRLWKGHRFILAAILPASAIVFILGLLNRFDIYPIDMQLKNPAFISTIGNINWYCGYLVTVFFGGLGLFCLKDWKKRQYKMLFGIYIAIGFAALVTQGSSSGIAAMLVVLPVMFSLSVEEGRRMQAFWEGMMIFSAVCMLFWEMQALNIGQMNYLEPAAMIFTHSIGAIILAVVSIIFMTIVSVQNKRKIYQASRFKIVSKVLWAGMAGLFFAGIILLIVNTASSGSISHALGLPEKNLITFTDRWGSNRGLIWKTGIACFVEQNFLHRLVGTGPDCMEAFLYTGGSAGLAASVKEIYGNTRLTNAHNEWLTVLVDMGVMGLIGYAGMMSTAAFRFLKGRRTSVIAGACGFCVLAYIINNMFSFQQSMSTPTVFILLGVGENYLRRQGDEMEKV